MRRPPSLKIVPHAVAALLIVAAAGYTAYWYVTAHRLEAGIEAWAAMERARGYDIGWDQPRVTGFPLKFRILATNGVVARGHPALWRVAAPRIVGEAAPWNLTRWTVEAPRGATATARGVEGPVTARAITAKLMLGAVSDRVRVRVRDLAAEGAKAGEVDADVTLPRRPPRNDRDPALIAAIQLYHLALPEGVRPLGNTIESMGVDFAVKGGLPVAADWRPALAAWSAAGGTVEIPHAAVEWGALALEAKGTLALDRDLQPEAALTATIVNEDALIDAAVATHLLRAKNAMIVKLVLGVLAKRGADGTMRLTAPVTIQNRMLFIDNIKVGKVPPIVWQ